MEVRPSAKDKWEVLLAGNQDSYGRAIHNCIVAWADEMERQLEAGQPLQDVLEPAKKLALAPYDISGSQFSYVCQSLIRFWRHGRDFRNCGLNNPNYSYLAARLPSQDRGIHLTKAEYKPGMPASTETTPVVIDDHLFIDLHSEPFEAAFQSDKNEPLSKFTPIKAVQADRTSEVLTIIDGQFETSNLAQPGDWIVTNPGGERYVIRVDRFKHTYELVHGNQYVSKAKRIIIPNITNLPIVLASPWDKQNLMFGDFDAMLASDAVYNGERLAAGDDRYLIEPVEAMQTYDFNTARGMYLTV